MFGFVPKWKATQGHAQETRPDIRGFSQEAKQGDIEEIEEGPEELLIEKIMDENGRNSKLLWFNPYQKIIQDMKGTHTNHRTGFPGQRAITLHSLFSDCLNCN